MVNLNVKYAGLLSAFTKEIPFKPDVALILGSGLGGFAAGIKIHKTIETTSLPGYPPSLVPGHAGKIHFAESGGKKILVFQGRIHFYEGYKLSECVLPVFISHKAGCGKIILTNAAGGINTNFSPGDLMLIKSFNGIFLKKELTALLGISSAGKKDNFLNLPSAALNKIIKESALEEKIDLKEGVYWYTKGPTYETPAEIRMMAKTGADAVGMSTYHEAVYASCLEMETAAVSCITNFAAGITGEKLSHAEVTVTAKLVEEKFERLIKRVINTI